MLAESKTRKCRDCSAPTLASLVTSGSAAPAGPKFLGKLFKHFTETPYCFAHLTPRVMGELAQRTTPLVMLDPDVSIWKGMSKNPGAPAAQYRFYDVETMTQLFKATITYMSPEARKQYEEEQKVLETWFGNLKVGADCEKCKRRTAIFYYPKEQIAYENDFGSLNNKCIPVLQKVTGAPRTYCVTCLIPFVEASFNANPEVQWHPFVLIDQDKPGVWCAVEDGDTGRLPSLER